MTCGHYDSGTVWGVAYQAKYGHYFGEYVVCDSTVAAPRVSACPFAHLGVCRCRMFHADVSDSSVCLIVLS